MTIWTMFYLIPLLLPYLYLGHQLNLKLNKSTLYAIFRMVVQLSVIGFLLQYLFNWDNTYINILYVLFMIGVATSSMLKTTELDKRFAIPVYLSVLIPQGLVLIYFNWLVVGLDTPFTANHLIPVGGMLLGNSLSGNIMALNNFYKKIKTQEKQYYFVLGLSACRTEALMPYMKDAIKSSISPTIASIETIGLVALPGMMTGQILGGSIPLTAIKYQIAIMVAILITRFFTAYLAIRFTQRYAFDDYDRLIL